MKTLMIWNEIPDEQPTAFLFDGDLSRFNGKYINEDDDEETEELSALMCGSDGRSLPIMRHADKIIPWPVDLNRLAGIDTPEGNLVIIHCGYIL